MMMVIVLAIHSHAISYHPHYADGNYCDHFWICIERQVRATRFAKNVENAKYGGHSTKWGS